jgi:hypothetical protein
MLSWLSETALSPACGRGAPTRALIDQARAEGESPHGCPILGRYRVVRGGDGLERLVQIRYRSRAVHGPCTAPDPGISLWVPPTDVDVLLAQHGANCGGPFRRQALRLLVTRLKVQSLPRTLFSVL